MRARQRLMPRKESVLDSGRETRPLSLWRGSHWCPGLRRQELDGAERAWARPGRLQPGLGEPTPSSPGASLEPGASGWMSSHGQGPAQLLGHHTALAQCLRPWQTTLPEGF